MIFLLSITLILIIFVGKLERDWLRSTVRPLGFFLVAPSKNTAISQISSLNVGMCLVNV